MRSNVFRGGFNDSRFVSGVVANARDAMAEARKANRQNRHRTTAFYFGVAAGAIRLLRDWSGDEFVPEDLNGEMKTMAAQMEQLDAADKKASRR